MTTFSLVFTLAVIGFGNAFYILAINDVKYGECEEEGCVPFTGNFIMTIVYSFRTGLGDFNDEGYEDKPLTWLIWIVFLLCAILLQIVLLNLLIAIMGDTFGRVTEIAEQTKLKELC